MIRRGYLSGRGASITPAVCHLNISHQAPRPLTRPFSFREVTSCKLPLNKPAPWIRQHLEPSPKARFSIYSIKHVLERHIGSAHCSESLFAGVAQEEGFQIKPSVHGDAPFATLRKEVRYV